MLALTSAPRPRALSARCLGVRSGIRTAWTPRRAAAPMVAAACPQVPCLSVAPAALSEAPPPFLHAAALQAVGPSQCAVGGIVALLDSQSPRRGSCAALGTAAAAATHAPRRGSPVRLAMAAGLVHVPS